MTRIIRLAGLLTVLPLLLAAPLQAQGVKPTTAPQKPGAAGPSKPGAAAPTFASCSAAEAQQVEAAFRDAAQLTRSAISALDANHDLPEYRRWFGAGPVAPVRRNLVLINDYLSRRRPPQIACNAAGMCPRGRFAYTMTQSGAMGFCELFFRAPQKGYDTAAGIVIHEVSHAAARTRDVAYSVRGAAVLAKDDPASAAVNADNYEYFVESLRR